MGKAFLGEKDAEHIDNLSIYFYYKEAVTTG